MFKLRYQVKKTGQFIFGIAFVSALVLTPSIVAVSDANIGASALGFESGQVQIEDYVIFVARQASDPTS